jgi:hypothetical protein
MNKGSMWDKLARGARQGTGTYDYFVDRPAERGELLGDFGADQRIPRGAVTLNNISQLLIKVPVGLLDSCEETKVRAHQLVRAIG